MTRKKRKDRQPTKGAQQQAPWYKRTWFIGSSAAVALSAVLLNGPQLLENARHMPKEVSLTNHQFKSWLADDAAWTGTWSGHPEGYVDIEDMRLSNTEMHLALNVTSGEIEGTIATHKLCSIFPAFDFILLSGHVHGFGHKATVTAWDIIQGHKLKFATLDLQRQGVVMVVKPVEGETQWFPSSARLGLGAAPSSGEPFCIKERRAAFKKIGLDLSKKG